MADHIESTFEIGIQDCVKIFFLHHGKQAVPGNACIIDKNLCSTEVSSDLCDSFLNRGKISHIALISPGFNTVFLSAFRADTLSSCCIPCKNNSCIGTHRRQFINDCFSDPPGAAGHNRCFPIQHLFIAAQHSSPPLSILPPPRVSPRVTPREIRQDIRIHLPPLRLC